MRLLASDIREQHSRRDAGRPGLLEVELLRLVPRAQRELAIEPDEEARKGTPLVADGVLAAQEGVEEAVLAGGVSNGAEEGAHAGDHRDPRVSWIAMSRDSLHQLLTQGATSPLILSRVARLFEPILEAPPELARLKRLVKGLGVTLGSDAVLGEDLESSTG